LHCPTGSRPAKSRAITLRGFLFSRRNLRLVWFVILSGSSRRIFMHDGEQVSILPTDTHPEIVVRKRRKGIYILPNLFTLGGLFGGFYAIVMAMDGRFDQAAIGVFCAMILDSLDGRIARMTNTQSAFGFAV
jgi:CDP-alcohol phosphatidyltransferase